MAGEARFDWDAANLSHIADHGVDSKETEQVLRNRPLDVEVQTRSGEERLVQIGETDQGRVLIVVITFRGERVRVITAFQSKSKLLRYWNSLKPKGGTNR